ncbi:adenylate/guanylate cyclase domain-containing protein [Microvirga sp. HBU67558]|uniref:adenylate/guanylate cyclase domain-containing protein n=1 Tax=Microvirga TaxID=186650 RepID=UPI001B37D4F4|nr:MULTISPECIES: adenylate/guanylate cyclase domain-containing protein [unclassified Microvirga]MBQ0819672.1 adenylate/guanylate cyclase domain-containing protein [Microvirga sp. HBU67558]
MDRQERQIERRLAAIFAADVAGYSRLMERDEVGTLRMLTVHREIMDRLISEHGGRIANTAGDSVLAEFPSAVNAVQCAVDVQEALAQAVQDAPEECRLQFRIGVHVGDVMVQGNDLLGDGVNIAARSEGLADPGGICISEAAYGYVRKTLPLAFTDLGSQAVKNFEEPVRAYSVKVTSPAANRMAETKPLPLPDRPSIAALPFTNMSPDPEQEFFADGMTEDIITGLSRLRWLFVIARNSTFAYKGKAVDVRQVARELGVRYVLEGSVRASGKRIRVTGQLIDAETGKHIWAEKYDRQLDDVFAVQDEITQNVVATIEPHLYAEESLRFINQTPENIATWSLVIRALALINKVDRTVNQEAQTLLNRAVAREPSYARSYAILAWAKWWEGFNQWPADRAAITALYKEAEGLAERALVLDPDEPWARLIVGLTLSGSGHHDRALEHLRNALDAHPNRALGRSMYGLALVRAGQFDEAISETGQALRMSPLDTFAGLHTVFHGLALMTARRFPEALVHLRRSIKAYPDFVGYYSNLISCCGHLGLLEEAQMYLQQRDKIAGSPYHVAMVRQNMSRFCPCRYVC